MCHEGAVTGTRLTPRLTLRRLREGGAADGMVHIEMSVVWNCASEAQSMLVKTLNNVQTPLRELQGEYKTEHVHVGGMLQSVAVRER